MSNPPIIVTFASWEDRFHLGFEELIVRQGPCKVIMYYFDRYEDSSYKNRSTVRLICEAKRSELVEIRLSLDDPAKNWRSFESSVVGQIPCQSNVIIHISTMPREAIWELLWMLELQKASIKYAYHRPGKYGEWLSRDPQKPRLVFKMSGLSKLGWRTGLVILAGYDLDRTQHLMRCFDPAMTLLCLQRNDRDADNASKMQEYISKFKVEPNVQLFEVDAFASDHGEHAVESLIKTLNQHNIIMSSLGPKLSAISLYRIQRAHPEIGLAYAPSREFNPDYSSGIGECIEGSI